MGIINGDTYIKTQESSQTRKHHNRVKLSKLHMRELKWLASTFRYPNLNPNKLVNMCKISTENAKEVTRTTTHTDVHEVTKPLTRLFKTRQYILFCWNLWVRTSTDTILLRVKYVQGNKACQIFVTNFGDVKVYPFNNKGAVHMALYQYFKDVGVPAYLHMKMIKRWNQVINGREF